MKNNIFFIAIKLVPRISITAIILILLLISPVLANNSITDDGKILTTNGSKWVKIDPISDHIIGDTFNLTGTTNLPIGTPVISGVYYIDPFCHMKYCSQEVVDSHVVSNSGEVQSGSNNSTNNLSSQFNTEKLISADDFEFSFQVPSILSGYQTHILMFPNTSREKINSLLGSSSSNERYWLLINSLTDTSKPIGEGSDVDSHFQVVGLTNLPDGDRIPYSIISSGGFYPPESTTQEIVLAGNNGYVVKGKENGVNNFILDVNASGVCDDVSYWVVIWNPRYNTTMPNNFMSTSMTFKCKDGSSNSSKIVSTLSSSESTVIPTPKKSSISNVVVCSSLILAGMLAKFFGKRM
jgi:hypothetical protein